MPTYRYRCGSCEHTFETIQSMKDAALTMCGECKTDSLRRVIFGGTFIFNHFKPFISPVTGKVIENARQEKYDLESSGCRIYEGRTVEQKEADRHNKYKELAFEREISQTIDQTAHEIEHGYREVSDTPSTLNMDWE